MAAWHHWALYYLNWKQDWEPYLDNKTTTLREERNQCEISALIGKESKQGKDQVWILPSVTLGNQGSKKENSSSNSGQTGQLQRTSILFSLQVHLVKFS